MTMIYPNAGGAHAEIDAMPIIERVGHCVVVHNNTDFLERVRPADGIPVENGRVPLVVDPAALDDLLQLSPRVLAALSRQLPLGSVGRRGAIRLLLSNTGNAKPGTFAFAAELSLRLDVDVLAPEGPLMLPRRGQMFCTGPSGAWRQFVGGRPAGREGPRFPAPEWQDLLAPDLRSLGTERVSVTSLPAGLWLRSSQTVGATTETDADYAADYAYWVPQSDRYIALLVGRPGEVSPSPQEVCEVIDGLPSALRSRALLLPYGPLAEGMSLAQQIADWSIGSILAAHVLPVETQRSMVEFVAYDDTGTPTWRPYVTISRYRRGHDPQPYIWTSPVADLAEADHGVYEIADGWALEVIASGMFVRPMQGAVDASARHRPIRADRIELAIAPAAGSTDPIPTQVLQAVATLLDRLPTDDRRRIDLISRSAHQSAQLREFAHQMGVREEGPIAPSGPDGGPGLAAVPAPEGEAVTAPRESPIRPHGPAPATATARSRASGRQNAQAIAGDSASPMLPSRPMTPTAVTIASPVPPAPLTRTASPARTGPIGEPNPPIGENEDVPTDIDEAVAAIDYETDNDTHLYDTDSYDTDHYDDDYEEDYEEDDDYYYDDDYDDVGVPPISVHPAELPPADVETTDEIKNEWLPVPAETSAEASMEQALPDTLVAAMPQARLSAFARCTPWKSPFADPSEVDDVHELRRRFGWQFDAATNFVTQLLSERPGLRGHGRGEETSADLAVVRLFASGADLGLTDAIRAGMVPESERSTLRWLVAGLHRLPSLTGPVLLGMPEGIDAAAAYEPGEVLVEPAPMRAVVDPNTPLTGPTECIIWSATGRRLDGLVDADQPAQVIFLPNTTFEVMAVDRSTSPARILLAETSGGRLDERRRERAETRLRRIASARAANGVSQSIPLPSEPAWPPFTLLPGLLPHPPAASVRSGALESIVA
ncbi:hypothetical protein SAMN05892883_4188 [Jatrophihabitans sp. GAS493]|uniref:hypothetical protein n=1 Tax=Jatrophihabitans sp. GAS493 TaxID=1907575 RepID=UPI000BB88F40|nr:hypothetical protein [Jatrophihabitans sp. GAS493]SOD74991.1 hypothetical protein SAMN05892883_4188 [Jatrophihabitans sp. GAS493]